MLEESLVFGGDHRIDHYRREIVEANYAALLARAVKKIRDQLRFDLGGLARDAIRKLRDVRICRRGEIDAQGIVFAE